MSGNNPFQSSSDPQDFLRQLWGNLHVPIPGMVTPTLDVDELEKRITDLKAVEGWLKMNLNMLQMSIQGLEMQKVTLAAIQSMSQAPADGSGNPFSNAAMNPAFWSWNFMNAAGAAPEAGGEAAAAASSTEAAAKDATPKATP